MDQEEARAFIAINKKKETNVWNVTSKAKTLHNWLQVKQLKVHLAINEYSTESLTLVRDLSERDKNFLFD